MNEVHILCFNEEEILPFTLRHYATFCDRMIVHDGGSTDRSREIATQHGAEVRDCVTDGVNDALFKRLKETCWRGTDADWVITCDADELIYFPEGWFHTLASYEADRRAVVKPRGFEMFGDTMPALDGGQIYEQITMGAEDAKWYAKPILFRPSLIREITFSAGSHTCWATLTDGRKIEDPQIPSDPETYLLHYHQIGGLERITRRYAAQQSRHSATNKKHRWGNFEPPSKHAADKRAAVMAKLARVIQ